MKRIMRTGLVTMMIAMLFAITTYAGSWQESFGRTWWMNDDGTYPTSGWHWIDSKNDGFAECYYFDENGYILKDTTTPDGYIVNADGKWVVDGFVQTQRVPVTGTLAEEVQYMDTIFKVGKMSAPGYDDIDYLLYVPENATENMPMIVSLKNFVDINKNEPWTKQSYAGFIENNTDKFNCYVLIPVLFDRHDANSTYGPQAHNIARLIQLVAQDKKVDMNRISIMGGSQSASGTIKMCSDYPELFSCGVPVAFFSHGGMVQDHIISIAASKIPMWFIGEDNSQVIALGTTAVSRINYLGGTAWFTLDEGADHGSCGGFNIGVDKFGVFDWMLAQVKK